MTPGLLTWGEGETDELSMEVEKSFILERVDLVPIRRISVLSQLSLRKFWENQDLIPWRQSEGGGREGRGGFDAQVKLGIICITMELNIIFMEKMAKREEIDNEQEGSKDRTLGYTRGEGGRMGSKCFELDKLSTSRQI